MSSKSGNSERRYRHYSGSNERKNSISEQNNKETDQKVGVVHVRNLSIRTNEDKLQNRLERFGKIDKVEIIRERSTGVSKRYGFIYFKNLQDAKNLVNEGVMEIDEREAVFELAKRGKPRPPTPGQYLGTTRKRSFHKTRRYSSSRSKSRSRRRSSRRDRDKPSKRRHRYRRSPSYSYSSSYSRSRGRGRRSRSRSRSRSYTYSESSRSRSYSKRRHRRR